MDQPKTQREMIQQLWFVVLGSNGDGLAAQVKAMRTDIAELKEARGRRASKTLTWVATTVGGTLLVGLLALAAYGIIHAFEAVPTIGNQAISGPQVPGNK